MYKDSEGTIIYVGKAKNLRNRMRSYFQSPEKLHPKVRAMMSRVSDFDFIVTATELEALILENNLIKAYHPRYNIDLRDDKTYPYLKITTGDRFPGIYIVREEKDKTSRYFGPYTDVSSLRQTLKILTTIFPVRTCKNFKVKERSCLNKDLGKCPGPCTGKVEEEEYRGVINRLIKFLEGDSREILKTKEAAMKEAALNLEYEKAAVLRDQVRNIKKIQEKQKVDLQSAYNLDLIGMVPGGKENLVLVFRIRSGRIIAKQTFWLNPAVNEEIAELMEFFLKNYYTDNSNIPQEILVSSLPAEKELIELWLQEQTGNKVAIRVPYRGDKKNILEMVLENARLLRREKSKQEDENKQTLIHLSKVLDIEVIPQRIECFDISHLGGEETVASMVVFNQGVPEKKAYRRFKIKVEQNNDFASLRETLQRRFTESRRENPSFLPEPDLVIIDGGLGQVNGVKEVLDTMGIDIPVFGLAKKEERIFQPGMREPLILSRRDEGLKLLQRVRDEAHRFAIEYNRKRRNQKIRKSDLDNIKGIGSRRKKALLNHFGSVSKIREATRDKIASVPGISQNLADDIYNYFRENSNDKRFPRK
jgi:excinuclease ABC subunit C